MRLGHLNSLKDLRAWRKNQIAVTISGSFVYFGFTLVMPFLPLYIRQLGIEGTGAVALWTGLILSISPAMAALAGPLWGRVGDRIGIKPMAARATGVNCLCWMLMGFTSNVWQLFLLRAILGLFGGFNNVSVTAVTQLSPKEKIGSVIGTLQSSQIIAAALGPLVGGVLAQSIGITNTFFATAILMLGSFLSIVLFYQDAEKKKKIAGSHEETVDHSFLKHPEYILPVFLLFFIHMSVRTFNPIIPLFFEELRIGTGQIAAISGALISVSAFGEALSAWISGTLSNRIGVRKLIFVPLGIGIVVLIAIVTVQTAGGFFVMRVALALLSGGTMTLAFTAASRVIPGDQRGAGFGILSSTSMFGGAAGPLIAGILAGISIRTVFIFNIFIYATMMVAVLGIGRRKSETAQT